MTVHFNVHHHYNMIRIKNNNNKKKNLTVPIAKITFIMLIIVSNPRLRKDKYPAEHSLTKIE